MGCMCRSRGCEDPGGNIHFFELMIAQLQAWRTRILDRPGTSVFSARKQHRAPSSPPRSNAFSDAAKEGADCPGVGGWCCGFWWAFEFAPHHLELDIPILEAIVAVANVMWMDQMLRGSLHLGSGEPGKPHVAFHVDAQATAHMLIKGKAKSPMMRWVHRKALAEPQYCTMIHSATAHHIFGRSNIASDAASRGLHDVLAALCRHLKVKSRQTPAPALASQLLDEAVAKQRAMY